MRDFAYTVGSGIGGVGGATMATISPVVLGQWMGVAVTFLSGVLLLLQIRNYWRNRNK